MEFDSQSILEPAPHCQYFEDSEHAPCPNRVEARLEPAPVGQFGPVDLCAPHTVAWIDDHSFHLGDDWSITPVDDEARGRIQEEFAPVTDRADGDFCESCGHERDQHAFFPNGNPAPLCVDADTDPETGMAHDTCECEGFAVASH